MSRLPPLNAIKAFEAAAQHLSFTRAAETLNVTQSAISHQVRILECHVGKPLFRRSPNGLTLTKGGASLFKTIHEALNMIATAVDDATQEAVGEIITITLRPFLSFNWLSPRLSTLYDTYPDARIRLNHTNSTLDHNMSTHELAIVLGDGNWPKMKVDFLMPCELTPICSPKLCQERHMPKHLSDLQTETLLHERTVGNWPRWLSLAGDPRPGPQRHIFIDDTNVRIQATVDGQGVALSNPKLLAPQIAQGRLVAPFDTMLIGHNYYILSRNDLSQDTKVIRDWIIEQASI